MRPRRPAHARQYRAGTLPARHCHDDGCSYHKRLWRLTAHHQGNQGRLMPPFFIPYRHKKTSRRTPSHAGVLHTPCDACDAAVPIFATPCDALRRFSKNTNTNSHLQATKRLAFFVTPCDICHKASQNALRRPPHFSSKIATFRTFVQSLKKPINDRIAGGR